MLSALLCTAFVPVVGLAVDGSIAYMIRLKVSTAVDAAAVAAARSLNTGINAATQAQNATSTAQTIYYANLPNAQDWGASIAAPSISVCQDTSCSTYSAHIRSVTVTGGATVPLTFLSMLGVKSTYVGFTATAQRRDVNVVLVLDHSGSMAGVLSSMQADAVDFVDMFASGRDNVGLVTFAGSAYVPYSPKTSFQTDSPNVPALIDDLTTYNGATNTSQAVWMAYQQLVTLNQPGALNVVVVFTDGLANTFAANFISLVSPTAGCSNLTSPLTGVILSDIYETGTAGLSDPTAGSINDPTDSRAAPMSNGCSNISSNGSPNWNISRYLTGLPSTDAYGNSTNGSGTIGAYAAVNLTQVTPVSVTNAGLDAFDDAANRIRSDTSLKPLIYTIGLGNNPGLPPDQVLLARVANDPSSPSYNSAQPAGLFVFSPTIAELHGAFLRVASEVLRLSR